MGNKLSTTSTKIERPKSENGIVMNGISAINNNEYVLAIGQIIKSENIISIFEIPGDQFCLYLKSKKFVDKLVYDTKAVIIKKESIEICSYTSYYFNCRSNNTR